MTVVERRHVARLGAPAVEPSAPDHRSARIAACEDFRYVRLVSVDRGQAFSRTLRTLSGGFLEQPPVQLGGEGMDRAS
jgi:hypothetical protein